MLDVFPNGLPNSIVVHDSYAAQFKIKCKGHQMCFPHLLREINFFIEKGDQWSAQFKQQLKAAIELYHKIKQQPDKNFKRSPNKINKNIDQLLVGKKNGKGLLEAFKDRMRKKTSALLRFLDDTDIPHDNNGSERAIRNIKVKSKIAGMFKSELGVDQFDVIRSGIDTFIKRDQAVLTSLFSKLSVGTWNSYQPAGMRAVVTNKRKKEMPKIKIATAQSRVEKSIEENGIEIRKLLKKGKSKGAKIVHFCEGALSGYSKNHLVNYGQINFEKIRDEISKIQKLCKELNIWAVFGCVHELSEGNRPHNSMYVISDSGEIANRYDKRRCSNNELLNWYTPGFEPCYFEVEGIKFSCALCIEIQFPELFIESEKQGVQCILFSSSSKEKMFGIQAQGYAASNNYWISMAIPTNESENLSSQLIAPNGEIQLKCKRNCSSIIVSKIDTENKKWHIPLNLAKPWRRLAREGDIYRTKKVVDKRSEMKTIC